jgi:hypothetical protein
MADQRQKILLLPPMKGLNLYDNPFTMDAQFAEDLTNFMPPTTELKVRPGVVSLLEFYGAVRGMYAYAVGTTKDYGEHWYDQTITDGEYQALLIKMSQNDGQTYIYAYNPRSNSYEIIQTTKDSQYTNDYAIYKHSLMMCTGTPSLPMTIWSSRTGWKNMKWETLDTKEITDLQNITFYNDMCLANVSNTFDIIVMSAKDVDPSEPSAWEEFWSWFSPKQTTSAQLSLEGVAKKGGSILKMFTMSKSGIETINSYFCVCTNMGEIIVWQGKLLDSSSEDLLKNPLSGPSVDFTLVGRFEIPIPLNKDCFCQMEGDMIVATQNGLFSLNRVVFGMQTEITQSLETRIQNVFDGYMFQDSAYQKFFGLYYYQKNRLLIFNTPTRMPQPMQAVKEGFVFGSDCYITLATLDDDLLNVTKAQAVAFIRSYLYYNWLDYVVYFQFNNSRDTTGGNLEGIFITFNTEHDDDYPENPYAMVTTMDFYITIKIKDIPNTTKFLENPIVFKCDDFTVANPVITTDSKIEWHHDLIKSMGGHIYYAYSFSDEAKKRGLLKSEEYELTGLIPSSSLFATPISLKPMYYLNPAFDMRNVKAIHFKKLIADTYLPDFPPSLEQFFLHFGQPPYPDGILKSASSSSFSMPFDEYKETINLGMHEQTPWVEKAIVALMNCIPTAPSGNGQIAFTYQIKIRVNEIEYNFKYIIDMDVDIIFTPDLGTSEIYPRISARYKCNDDDLPIVLTATDNKYDGISYYGYYYIDTQMFIRSNADLKPFTNVEITETKYLDTAGKKVEFVSATGSWFVSPQFLKADIIQIELEKQVPPFTVTADNWTDIAKKYGWLMSMLQLEIDDSPEPIPPPPSPPPELNLEDCVEGMSLSGYGNLSFSGILEDPNYANFPHRNYNDFSTSSSLYWYDNGHTYIAADVLGKNAFTPFGLDIQKEIMTVFVNKYDEIVGSADSFFSYTISYNFLDTRSLDSYILKFFISFHFSIQDSTHIFFIGSNNNPSVFVGYYLDDHLILPTISSGLDNFLCQAALSFNKNNYTFQPVLSTEGLEAKDNIIDFSESDDWVIQSISASSDFSANPDLKQYFNEALPEFEHVTLENLEKFKAAYGYLMSGFRLSPTFSSPLEKEKIDTSEAANKSWAEILIPKKRKILVRAEGMERIKAKRISRGDAPSPAYAVQNANFDLNQVPLLANSNIVCNYASTQYVMNSYYGTWSRWTDVNMIHGASHLGEFYFIRPMDIPEGSYGTGFVYNKSMLCKFDATAFGDLGRQPISVSYRTASTNSGANNYKLYQRMKIIATRSTFWGTKANDMRIIVLSDFVENPPYFYQYSTIGGEELILRTMGLHGKKQLHELDFRERKKFNELYAIESAVIDSGEIGLLCRPSNRMGIIMSMNIVEANIIIYGYEITLKTLNKV